MHESNKNMDCSFMTPSTSMRPEHLNSTDAIPKNKIQDDLNEEKTIYVDQGMIKRA